MNPRPGWLSLLVVVLCAAGAIPPRAACGQSAELPGQMRVAQWPDPLAGGPPAEGAAVIVPEVGDWLVPSPAGPLAAPLDPNAWSWQLLPETLIYHSYLAGLKEPRFAGLLAEERDRGTFLDGAVGARIGLMRFGDQSELFPQGWQLDVESAAFLRFDAEQEMDMDSVDYRLGVPLTWGVGRFQGKAAFYHLSAHAADEFLLKNPGFPRINYSRDVLVLGGSYFPSEDWRVYAEVGYATYVDGGSEPWEFQFGVEYSPARVIGPQGAPFVAANGHLREEVSFGGEFVLQAGWQWRARPGSRLVRIGAQYFNGQNDQYQFFRTSEQHVGLGIWYDF